MTSTGCPGVASSSLDAMSAIVAAMTSCSGLVAAATAIAGVSAGEAVRLCRCRQRCEGALRHIDHGGGDGIGDARPVDVGRQLAVRAVAR